MSTTVDSRVVEMRFDNRDFENNVKTSISTLDKLKQCLQLKDASKGLENLDKTVKKVDMNPLSKGVETVSLKFSALQVAGVTALSNITNSAVNAGKRIASALTIDPIKTGFQEYETQINAVQTILANTESKGSTLQDVNNALAELNTYADKTIYNFTEMTRNIGTFTAAGVDLKTSVSAIKGIANLAAVSGSTSQQASTAMYQLSQALASGTVKLMDWNSVVNAGMGGQVFQDSLKETARVHGVAIDDMIKKNGSFRETLKDGWLTSEILTETLSKFTGDLSEKQLKAMGYTEEQIAGIMRMGQTANDAATKVKTFTQLFDTLKEAAQSGWTKTWEIIIGDFGEAKELLTEISDMIGGVIGGSSDFRNELLGGALSTGWKQLLNQGINDAAGFEDMFKNVAKGKGVDLDSIIKMESISQFTQGMNEMSEAEMKMSGYTQDQIDKLNELNKGVQAGTISLDDYANAAKEQGADLNAMLNGNFDFQDAMKKAFNEGKLGADAISESVSKFTEKVNGMSEAELEAAGYTREQIVKLNELNEKFKDGTLSAEEFMNKIARPSGRELLIESLRNAIAGLQSVIKPVSEAFKEIFPAPTAEQLYKAIEKFRDFTANLKLSDEQASKLKSTFKGLFAGIDIVVTVIKEVAGGIISLLGNLTGLGNGVLAVTGSFGDWVSNLRNAIKESDIFGKTVGKITQFLQSGINAIKTFAGFLKEKIVAPGWEGFLNVMQGVWNVIQKIGGAIGKVASTIGSALSDAFNNGSLDNILNLVNGGILTGILLGIKKFITGITDSFNGSESILDKLKGILDSVKDSLSAWQQDLKASTLLKIAGAVGILALSLLLISSIDPVTLTKSLGAITVLFGDLMGSMALMNKMGGITFNGVGKAVTAMIGISVAVLILASALKKIAGLGVDELAKGLGGILGLTAIITTAAKLMSRDGKKIVKGAGQMVIMAVAIKILASACEDLSKLSWEGLGKGVSAIGVILAEFVGFQALMQLIKVEKMKSSAVALVIIGAAMEIFADV